MPGLTFESNPILKREVRSRWRGKREFVLVFCWLAVVCFFLTLGYWGTQNALELEDLDGIEEMAKAGHQIFTVVSYMQLVLWMVVATAISATSIARERELGLLEALQLSPIHAARIVAGKFWSIVVFLMLVQLTLLPLQGLGFAMGGVSPGEMIQCWLLQMAALVTCTALGLCCSAWCRRPGGAVVLSFIVVLLWIVPSDIIHAYSAGDLELLDSIPGPYMLYRMEYSGSEPTTLQQVILPVLHGNPLNATFLTVTTGVDLASQSRYGPNLFSKSTALPAWLGSLLFQGVITCLSLMLSWRGTRKIWADAPPPVERKRFLTLQFGARAGARGGLRLAATALPEAGEEDENIAATRGWWNAPLLSLIRSRNPILQREMRQRLQLPKPRSPQKARLMWLARIGMLVGYAIWMLKITFFNVYATEWPPVSGILIIVMAIAGYIGARAFSKERETGTWEGLVLSRLPAHQVIVGKLLPVLLINAFYFTLLLVPPVMLRSASFFSGGFVSLPLHLNYAWVIAVFSLGVAAAWGLLVSWFSKRSTAAVGWTLGPLAAWLIVLPLSWTFIGPYIVSWTQPVQPSSYAYSPGPSLWGEERNMMSGSEYGPLLYTNPLVALDRLQEMARATHNTYPRDDFAMAPGELTLNVCCGLTVQALFILAVLFFVMRRHHGREPDRMIFARRPRAMEPLAQTE